MRMAVWNDVLHYVAEKIKVIEDAPTVTIGGKRPEMLGIKPDSNGAVVLIRGVEEYKYNGLQYNVAITFFLQAWIRNDDPDMVNGYDQLAVLEEKVDAVISSVKEISGMMSETAQLMDISVKRRAGDLDSRRPLCGSQYTIEAFVYEAERG